MSNQEKGIRWWIAHVVVPLMGYVGMFYTLYQQLVAVDVEGAWLSENKEICYQFNQVFREANANVYFLKDETPTVPNATLSGNITGTQLEYTTKQSTTEGYGTFEIHIDNYSSFMNGFWSNIDNPDQHNDAWRINRLDEGCHCSEYFKVGARNCTKGIPTPKDNEAVLLSK